MANDLLLLMLVIEVSRQTPLGALRCSVAGRNNKTKRKVNMRTYSGLLSCTGLLPLSRLCRFRHKARLLAAALFLFFVAVASNASAQTVSNCVTVICPPPFVTNYTCEDVYIPQTYPIIVSNRCPNVQVQVNCNPPPGTPLGLGAHPVH